MTCVIVGTNRSKSEAAYFAKYYLEGLQAKGEEVHFLHLKDISPEIYHSEMYDSTLHPQLLALQEEILLPCEKFVFIVPEYNGGMPGALKLWIDALSIRKRAATFGGKKGAVVGVAAGRAGNLRGIDQLVGILHYLNMTVLPHLQPYSQINKLLDENGTITDANTLEVLQKHVERIAAM